MPGADHVRSVIQEAAKSLQDLQVLFVFNLWSKHRQLVVSQYKYTKKKKTTGQPHFFVSAQRSPYHRFAFCGFSFSLLTVMKKYEMKYSGKKQVFFPDGSGACL